jgi:hypothetical protein
LLAGSRAFPARQMYRKCSQCADEREDKLHPKVAASPPATMAAPPIVDEVLRSPGQPLDSTTRAFMEPRFGFDFSGVRVHTDRSALESAHAVSAQAYTVGQHIVFGAGRYAPGTEAGHRLLAHELAHTIQQGHSHFALNVLQRADDTPTAPVAGAASGAAATSGSEGSSSDCSRCGTVDKGSLPRERTNDMPCTPSPTVRWFVPNGRGGWTTCWFIEYRCDVRTDSERDRDESWWRPGRPYINLQYAGPIRETGCDIPPETEAEDPGRARDVAEWGTFRARPGPVRGGGGGRR